MPFRPPPAPIEHRLEFSGEAREYFRLWIVNLALSLLTLGLYSAWAKVRTQRWFYGHTRLAGVPFEYLAQPLPILKGRLIAAALFASYVLVGQVSVRGQLAVGVLIALATPWLIVRGLMFRARYSSWRGLTFRFDGSMSEAIRVYCLYYLLVPLTLGLIYPYIRLRQKRFMVENHRYGAQPFTFGAELGDFFPVYFGAGVGMVAWAMLVGLIGASTVAATGNTVTAQYVLVGLIYSGYFMVWVFVAARIANVVYSKSSCGGARLQSTLPVRGLLGIYLGNTLAILASAGLLVPWAMVRLARFRAQHTAVITTAGFDAYLGRPGAERGAFGSEMDQLFDLDVDL